MRTLLVVMLVACLLGVRQTVMAAEMPKAVEVVVPGYPRLPSGAREEGEVNVDLQIDKDGKVAGAKATTGPERLRPWAEVAARKWRFERPEAGREKIQVIFAFVLQRGLTDPPAVANTFKAPNRVEVFAEKRDLVIIADPPVEDVIKKQKQKRPSK